MDTAYIESLIGDLALILILGAISTVLFKLIKQPVVLGYIVAGFIASPHFSFFPSVAHEANIEFWAQIGIIVLLFSLGLEFSFKKLLNVGGSAVVTASIIVIGMMGLGFIVGRSLGYHVIDSIFLGGMLSMSSTTIILKALTDLNLRQRRFVPMIFAVLIVEDLFAVVLMVILSSIAINKSVQGDEMIGSVLKLSFFLIIWFTIGIFLIPSIFKKFRRVFSDEMMLVISMGLCFMMAIFSVQSGFSLALGAFVMGSILAGTNELKRIERLVSPIKDLFGAVFFISVGMMVDPQVIINDAGTIAILAVVVIVGMIVFGTFGMLATGQPLKNAIQSGFALTQIGEFSFIIASLGMSLGVLQSSIYPIIVAVSVLTTFTTPFFIKCSDGVCEWLEKVLPSRWTQTLGGYSKKAVEGEMSEARKLWVEVSKRYFVRFILYFVVVIGLIVASRYYLLPFVTKLISGYIGKVLWALGTLLVISPFIYALMMPAVTKAQRKRLVELSGNITFVPVVVMTIISVMVSIGFMVIILEAVCAFHLSLFISCVIAVLLALVFSPILHKRLAKLEKQFVGNANARENRRTGKDNNLVSDMLLAYMTVGYGCPFAGRRLKDADLRKNYGVNIANIERNGRLIPVPTGDMRMFPGDTLGVIGTEEQIETLLPLVETAMENDTMGQNEAKFLHLPLSDKSPILGKKLSQARLREDYSTLLVSIQRVVENEIEFIAPTPDAVFMQGDILWMVGDPSLVKKFM
ncbi:MAG: cation:proton antiporter [Bacteroidales bacterium]|nr:cation:proton antiporter [Candidatus Sodaliphilus aphodohippi]